MPTPHSSVNYVEPNLSAVGREFQLIRDEDANYNGRFENWKYDDDYARTPKLEDYSITLNLEVELCSRKNICKNETVTKDVLILSFTTNNSNGSSVVNFMGGTKIECHDKENHSINFLTTNYADMYVGDLIHYGTTEMIGIKSVDIEYQKSCVPIINIKFTDVRGLSLFQPTELSRTNAYQGIGGINADNVAQSFFQCFFRVPMPKFTITIKGFYGKPVTYEVLCDKFQTSFNSDTGDFDIDTRFIGYSYSFLTDIVMDALLTAPYSDYDGKEGEYNKYWAQEINSGRFTIPNKEGTHRDNMPTLFEIWRSIQFAFSEANSMNAVINDEENTHAQEIEELQNLKELYSLWYTTLYGILCDRYGEQFCYLFTDKGCHYRILLLTSPRTEKYRDLSTGYENFPDTFKEINKRLYAAIKEYNSKSTSFKKLKDISIDFSEYKRGNLFNKLFVNEESEIVFNGFHKANNLPQTDVFSKIFNSIENTSETASSNIETHKRKVLKTIYNDGIEQYIDRYCVDVDYRSIEERIRALQVDANRSIEDKQDERRIKAFNKAIFDSLKWYPSVENFTRIMMAHLETLMTQMYECVSKCEGRKASELGVNPKENFDVNMNNETEDPEIPPFPRVHRAVIGNDNITKDEDAWVGDFEKGTKGFDEVNFINGLFNGAEYVMALFHDVNKAIEEKKREYEGSESPLSTIIKHPLSSFDFYITKSPYGRPSEISLDDNGYALAGRIAIRMFDILGCSYFREETWGKKFFASENYAKTIGRIEADNFYETTKLTNDRIITMIRNGVFSPDKIIDEYITNPNDKMPWGNKALFSNSSKLWLDRYYAGTSSDFNSIYPIQDISFSELNTAHSNLMQKKITNSDGNISLRNIPNSCKDSIANQNDNYGYGTTLIVEDINLIERTLSDANIDVDSGYTDVYNTIVSATSIDNVSGEKYGYNSFANVEGGHSISVKITTDGTIQSAKADEDKNAHIIVNGSDVGEYKSVNDGFLEQSKNGDFSSIVITEVFSPNANGGIDKKSSLLKWLNNKDESGKELANKNPLRGKNVGGCTLSIQEADLTLALMGILLNTNEIGEYLLYSKKTVLYLPKLSVLQIGAIIYASGGIHADFHHIHEVLGVEIDQELANKISTSDSIAAGNMRKECLKWIPVGSKEDYDPRLMIYIATLNKTAKHQYEKYFLDWVKSHSSYASKLCYTSAKCYLKTDGNDNRRILNQNSDFVRELTSELLKAVCVVKLSIHHHRDVDVESYKIPKGIAKSYLEGFIEKLEERYEINTQVDENGNITRTSDTPHKTTKDMKKELYRYMKQLYDKWIPMSSLKDWKLESFFMEKGGEETGHKFYFIDSYYNDISQKLLINPKIVSEKISALLASEDINSMLLGFMADMYSANKSMLMVIQNFADLKKPHSMDEMFTPLPYNSISWADVNKYPSFVVVYPYQASRNLDIPNGEYTNDGFMLNDEFETPLAVRSKTDDGQYKIPAFGVSYGKQYQSYFKKVNINMQSPVATEQSIKAKHAILRASKELGEGVTKGQDLYDVYATQSYTCDVEMMGCAWVQPLMYFVLLNVPMFRGSYMIMKVKHSIKPGQMTTNFTGCRMANVTNTLVEDMFSDGMINNVNSEYYEFENDRQILANVDNNCPYKVYPVGGDETTLSGDKIEKGIQFMKLLITISNNSLNLIGAAGIAGNAMQESGLKHTVCVFDSDGYLAGGLFGWNDHYGNLSNMCTNNVDGYGDKPVKRIFTNNEEGKQNAIRKLTELGLNYQITFMLNTIEKPHPHISISKLNACSSPSDAAEMFRASYEKGTKGKRCKNAEELYEAYKKAEESGKIEEKVEKTKKEENEKRNINSDFFEAIKKSAMDTPSIRVELKMEKKAQGYIKITQVNESSSEKLDVVFDLILNTPEYYKYVQELGWIYPNGGLETSVPPSSVYCKVVEKIEPNKERGVFTCEKGKWQMGLKSTPEIPTKEDESNPLLLKPLAKRRAAINNDENFKKEVPQVKDLSGLDKYMPSDCNSVFCGGGYIEGAGANSSWAQAVQTMGKWYEENIHRYSHNYVSCNILNGSKVREDCSGYVSACLQLFGKFKLGYNPRSKEFAYGTNVAKILTEGGFTKLEYSWEIVQPYDIISYDGHVEILAIKANSPKSWAWGNVHDCRNGHDCMPSRTGALPKGKTYKTIWRYTAYKEAQDKLNDLKKRVKI